MLLIQSLMFMFRSPLQMSIILVVLTIFSTYESLMVSSDPWVPMIFCMVFFGGLLILFVYISSLAGNDKTYTQGWKLTLGLPIVFIVSLVSSSDVSLWGSEEINVAGLLFLGSNLPLVVFSIKFYMVVIIFLIFDVEIALILPLPLIQPFVGSGFDGPPQGLCLAFCCGG